MSAGHGNWMRGTETRVAEHGAITTRVGSAKPPVLRRFHGSATLNSTRLSRDVDAIATSVVQHLAGLLDAKVKVTLEIEAEHSVRRSRECCSHCH